MKIIYLIIGIVLGFIIVSILNQSNRSDINMDGKVDMADVSTLMNKMN